MQLGIWNQLVLTAIFHVNPVSQLLITVTNVMGLSIGICRLLKVQGLVSAMMGIMTMAQTHNVGDAIFLARLVLIPLNA